MFKSIRDEVQGIIARDPAVSGWFEVVVAYPSFWVMRYYRFSNWLWKRGARVPARWLMQMARWGTGIEIHPGATIGERFFIDHGMGVVIGEMAEIGDDVTLYHGVTLGGVSPSVDSDQQRNVKRHPTLGHGVIVGSGAQILGPIVVGDHARVGANAVVTRNVEARTTMVGIPAKPVQLSRAEQGAIERFVAYGTPLDLMDPNSQDSDALRDQVALLKARLNALEHAVNSNHQSSQASPPLSVETGSMAEKLPGK